MAKIIGFDLGTSNFAVAIGRKPTIIPAAEDATVGGKAFPSSVAFSKNGEPAHIQAVTNPDGTTVSV